MATWEGLVMLWVVCKPKLAPTLTLTHTSPCVQLNLGRAFDTRNQRVQVRLGLIIIIFIYLFYPHSTCILLNFFYYY